jgi:hypothetical protein
MPQDRDGLALDGFDHGGARPAETQGAAKSTETATAAMTHRMKIRT